MTPPPEKEIIVVRDGRIERLFLGRSFVRYEGWSSLRSYFNEARSALAMEALGGKAPALGPIAAQCTLLLHRQDRINGPTRDARRRPREAPDPGLRSRLGHQRDLLNRALILFSQGAKTPHYTPVPFSVWQPGQPPLGRYAERKHRMHILPQTWLGEFKGIVLWARRPQAGGNVFVIRRRGNQALVADSSSRLWVGTLTPHHRKMHFTVEDEGLWDSLLAD